MHSTTIECLIHMTNWIGEDKGVKDRKRVAGQVQEENFRKPEE